MPIKLHCYTLLHRPQACFPAPLWLGKCFPSVLSGTRENARSFDASSGCAATSSRDNDAHSLNTNKLRSRILSSTSLKVRKESSSVEIDHPYLRFKKPGLKIQQHDKCDVVDSRHEIIRPCVMASTLPANSSLVDNEDDGFSGTLQSLQEGVEAEVWVMYGITSSRRKAELVKTANKNFEMIFRLSEDNMDEDNCLEVYTAILCSLAQLYRDWKVTSRANTPKPRAEPAFKSELGVA
jgi:hypothetical protein